MTTKAMTWLLGVDLRPKTEGAVAFASWLASATKDDRVVPIHVLVADHLHAVLQHHHLAEVKDAAKVAINDVIKRHDKDDHFDEPMLVEGGTAEGRLEILRNEQSADALVVNRFATESRRRLRRLGRVARRTLRASVTPVITVPPLLEADSVGKGPVIVTSNLTDECKHAMEFARDVAHRLGRTYEVVHVRRLPDQQATHYLGDDTRTKMTDARKAEAAEALAQWVEKTGLTPDEQVVRLGEVVTNVSDHAQERDACLIVAGARRLSKLERFFVNSVGGGLSATAPTPVAIVPPKS